MPTIPSTTPTPTPPTTFVGARRIHMGLAVSDLARATRFYETLLGIAPSKVRPGYAKFEPADPSVNLSLIESPSGAGMNPANHLGVQVKSSEAVAEATRRFKDAGIAVKIEEETACCYATQTKVWAADPDGNRWEVFHTIDDADTKGDDASTCCQVTGCCETASQE